jgi:hypothetical protein
MLLTRGMLLPAPFEDGRVVDVGIDVNVDLDVGVGVDVDVDVDVDVGIKVVDTVIEEDFVVVADWDTGTPAVAVAERTFPASEHSPPGFVVKVAKSVASAVLK